MKIIIFDFDGTLADTHRDIAELVNMLRKELGFSPKSIEEITSYIGDGVTRLLERAIPEYEQPEDLREKFLELYERNPVMYTRLYPHVRETLSELKNRNYELAILTNKPEKLAKKILNYFGLAHMFSIIVGEDTLPVRKPDPGTVKFILDATDFKKEEASMVGDGLNDIKVAKNAGITSVLAAYGYGDTEKLKELEPDFIISDFAELLDIFPALTLD